MKEEILTEITNNCEECIIKDCCVEEDCTLWRIEQIVTSETEGMNEK